MSNDQTRATKLYIFWFLHQTTTSCQACQQKQRCISFDSYIKPQRFVGSVRHRVRCISFDSYIKPQPSLRKWCSRCVVYLLIPTSNHNSAGSLAGFDLLYIFWFLHQTTTGLTNSLKLFTLYIFWFLHQTTTHTVIFLRQRLLYIFWFLHQTTTSSENGGIFERCISFDSYIKPQLVVAITMGEAVVYLLIPTSNHNLPCSVVLRLELYIFWFLHQTTTQKSKVDSAHSLYIFWFLHQTTT